MKYSEKNISDQELDQLFRDAHAAESVEKLFVPAYWAEMEQLLPKKERVVFPFWMLFSVASIVLVALLVFPLSNTSISSIHQSAISLEKTNGNLVYTKEISASNQERRSNSSVAQKKVYTKQQHLAYKQQTHFIADDRTNKVSNEFINNDTHISIPSNDVTLEPRFETLAMQSIQNIPSSVAPERKGNWYLEIGPSIGQSPYISTTSKRNVAIGGVIGGGYKWKLNNTIVGLGGQLRIEDFGGLQYRETNFAQEIQRTVTLKQMYSFDLPLQFGFSLHKSEISFAFVPGVQIFSHGKEEVTTHQQLTRQGTYTGKVEHSNSLTMKMGLNYYFNFNDKWSLGARAQVDILRPLHTDFYLGKSVAIPFSGQLLIRRTF